ncbi:MAG: glutamate-5-semialdehyde dehydrogenase [Verrucomicrobiales bacterium]|jgi:glutamate-5-semialdehyde dehydrogenase
MDALQQEILDMGKRARKAALALGNLTTSQKNAILESMADAMIVSEAAILEANAKDLAAAEANGLSSAMSDRLRLDGKRIAAIADAIRQVAALPDPVGETLADWTRPNGLHILKKRVPIGVIGIIFESRPNVTSDAAVLCFKSGNATILRGGKEAIHSNGAIADALDFGGREAGMPEGAIQLIRTPDRATVKYLAEMDQYLDLIIPRGGKGLIETVVSLARMPVIKHYDGICHTYVDKDADLAMAKAVAINAKTHKPSVCNAMETLLVHRDVAETFYADAGQALLDAGVTLRGDATLEKVLPGKVEMATEEDWVTEYLELVLAVKTVDSLDDAIDHINTYSSRHSDCIVTAEVSAAERFLNEIDSAAVFWNTSTRFSDGEEFGFGAEIGISTDKLHARGPMALPELTSYKYLVTSDGLVRG